MKLQCGIILYYYTTVSKEEEEEEDGMQEEQEQKEEVERLSLQNEDVIRGWRGTTNPYTETTGYVYCQ